MGGGLAPACRRGVCRAVAFCLLVGGVSLLAAAPAWGLGQRGHAFGFSFGSEGEGAGQFRFEGGAFKHDEAAGVAVSEATGDVYVVDRGNDRVEQFRPELGAHGELVGEEFVAAWGWGVGDGKGEYEVCTSACKAGVGGVGKGELKEAGPIAVDNAAGGAETVFVGADGSAKRPDVQRFTPDGEKALGEAAGRRRRRAGWVGDGFAGAGVGLSWGRRRRGRDRRVHGCEPTGAGWNPCCSR